jgi:hypothetical protein
VSGVACSLKHGDGFKFAGIAVLVWAFSLFWRVLLSAFLSAWFSRERAPSRRLLRFFQKYVRLAEAAALNETTGRIAPRGAVRLFL